MAGLRQFWSFQMLVAANGNQPFVYLLRSGNEAETSPRISRKESFEGLGAIEADK